MGDYVLSMERLVGVVQELSLARSLEAIQAIVRRAARELTGADGATFILRDGDQCFYADEDAIAPLWKGRRFPMSACVSGWAMLNRRSCVIEDIYADDRVPADAYRATFVKSMAMVPIRTADPVGAIGAYWATRRMPTSDEVKLLQALADSTSIAMEHVQSEAARRQAEDQLRQSQKLDAIGKLAGGIAHDFNNMLSVILSYASMLLEEVRGDDPHRADLEEIRTAGERAAALTSQLLAFGRQQVVQPTELDLNAVCAEMQSMLRRLIGEDIALDLRPYAGLDTVVADSGQIEQVLMNLVLNARDALPKGGTIRIETANVHLDAEYASAHVGVAPGDYVMLAVTDDGVGMDRTTQARIFEPFFTTKPAGKGTGLGLPTVYGIVKQNGGHVKVESEPARGTTIQVYLPAAEAPDAVRPRATAMPSRKEGTETILLVEDDDQVRGVTRGILRRAGYRVLEAGSASEALRACAEPAAVVDLLVTDVVMPDMSGVELAKRLGESRPGMKILCTSGYTDEAVLRHGLVETGLAFLQKPITPDALLTRVRQVLDGA